MRTRSQQKAPGKVLHKAASTVLVGLSGRRIPQLQVVAHDGAPSCAKRLRTRSIYSPKYFSAI